MMLRSINNVDKNELRIMLRSNINVDKNELRIMYYVKIYAIRRLFASLTLEFGGNNHHQAKDLRGLSHVTKIG